MKVIHISFRTTTRKRKKQIQVYIYIPIYFFEKKDVCFWLIYFKLLIGDIDVQSLYPCVVLGCFEKNISPQSLNNMLTQNVEIIQVFKPEKNT